MEETTSGTNKDNGVQDQNDPWLAAFAALEPKSEETAEGDAEGSEPDVGGTDGNTGTASGEQEVPAEDESGNGDADETPSGGVGTPAGKSGESHENAFANMQARSEEELEKYEDDLKERIRAQAIKEMADVFIERGIRNTDGKLGATLDDPDICKRDEDGVPRFYNPDTGREFTGDNPRRQAQEWVDDYNKELERVFNTSCAQYERTLMNNAKPELELVKFASKYEKLDPIRKGMFDNVIQDYEIKDDGGKIIGYECDLDKALSLVDRQIAMIQQYAKSHASEASGEEPEAQEPVLDMNTSSGAVRSQEPTAPKSLAEAMERIQNEELEKLKRS